LYLALRVRQRERLSRAKRFYSYSIFYIALLFVAMIATAVPFAGVGS
jgi:heme O synthase-like polyprenyltransferase